MKTNIKMRVTPEQSAKVQEIVFANGGEWIIGSREVQSLGHPFLYISSIKILTLSPLYDRREFEESQNVEVDADLFIRTNGTCEEQDPTEPMGYGILDKEEKKSKMNIDDTLKQRGEVYGSFEAQAEYVGKIINGAIRVATDNNRAILPQQIGSIAYIAIKLARFTVNPNHLDSMHDLECYARLINELYQDKGETK